MSLICPLCGKNKPEDSLFCEECTKKISSDFEINIHEKDNIKADTKSVDTKLPESEELDSKSDNSKEHCTSTHNSKEYNTTVNNHPKRGKKSVATLFWIFIGVILLIGAFLIYNKTILDKTNENRAWETAVNVNSVNGYLDYIESFPDGIHFDDAQAGLMKLKEEEAITWEKLKVSENLDELVNFSRQYENSPYIPLLRNRIDSLSWISALKLNSVESYSEYLENSQGGLLNGDYVSEASKRHKMLYQSTPVNNAEIDSIRTTINGFYVSLSEIKHAGMYNYLAPEVHRFFDSGGTTREKITGELMVTAAQIGSSRFNFEPNLEGVQYEKEINGSYKINVPVVKSYSENGSIVHLPGYIAHVEMNNNFEIRSIYETKPFPGSP